MKNSKLALALIFTFLFSTLNFAQVNTYQGRVVEIVDGRTVVVEPQRGVKITLELQHIEVPEPEQKLHQVVKDHLKKLLLNQVVEFKPRGFSETKTVGRVVLNGVDISQQMVRDGAAWYAVANIKGQDDSEVEAYRSIESQAKAEKRGIWSVTNLKPAWEFRAEKEEKRRQEEERKKEEKRKKDEAKLLAKGQGKNQKRAKTYSVHTRLTAEERQRANENVNMWADVSGYKQLISIADLLDKTDASNSYEPITGYDSIKDYGYVATRLTKLELRSKKGSQNIFGMLIYNYSNGSKGTKYNQYVLSLISESPEENLADASVLTVFADNKKFQSIGARRSVKKISSGVQEIIGYRLDAKDIEAVQKAKKLKFSLGKYRGEVSGAFFKKIQRLLSKLK